MDAKTILNPKWWLLAFGVLFFLAGLSNYLGAEGSADTAYPGDYTARDVFFEQTFGLFTMVAATLAATLAAASGEMAPLRLSRSAANMATAAAARAEQVLVLEQSTNTGTAGDAATSGCSTSDASIYPGNTSDESERENPHPRNPV